MKLQKVNGANYLGRWAKHLDEIQIEKDKQKSVAELQEEKLRYEEVRKENEKHFKELGL